MIRGVHEERQVDRTVRACPSATREKPISSEVARSTNQGEVRDARKIELHLEHGSASTSSREGFVRHSFVTAT